MFFFFFRKLLHFSICHAISLASHSNGINQSKSRGVTLTFILCVISWTLGIIELWNFPLTTSILLIQHRKTTVFRLLLQVFSIVYSSFFFILFPPFWNQFLPAVHYISIKSNLMYLWKWWEWENNAQRLSCHIDACIKRNNFYN